MHLRQRGHIAKKRGVETQKVHWPSRKEVRSATLVVLLLVAIVAFFLVLSRCRTVVAVSLVPWELTSCIKGPEVMGKQWYIVHTYSGYERKAKAALEERIRTLGKQEAFGDVLVPEEQVVELIKGRKRTSARKFFPGLYPRPDGNE